MLKFNLIVAVFFLSISIQAQNKGFLERKNINIIKNGPYFGVQKGKFIIAELGGERQWKDYQLRKPKTHALNLGFNYDFTNDVLGYDVGYWYKPSNIAFKNINNNDNYNYNSNNRSKIRSKFGYE